MQCVFKLPNGKEVVTKEFLFKDSRQFFFESSLEHNLNKLEDFIVTKNLNALEKFITLLYLRKRCLKQSFNININGLDKDVGIDLVIKNFDEIIDIRQEKEVGNLKLVLDYPSKFLINTDNIFSVIKEIKIDNDAIDLNNVSDQELIDITNNLPTDVLTVINEFINDNKHVLEYTLIPNNDDYEISFLNASPFYFLQNLFNCIDEYTYREYIFVLSKRIKDVSFLLNSTFKDILDYMDLYMRENEEQNDKVAKLDN